MLGVGNGPAGVILRPASPLHAALHALAREARLVFFAGLPGTGKSLLIHQLAHLAHAGGRSVVLLQWDAARPVFEASAPGRRYPLVDGVTHGVIRLAAGRWARDAVSHWHEQHPDARHFLIAETPFVGHRFIELARPAADAVESILTGESSRFVIPVPSRPVRRYLEVERERRTRRPQHEREREDAPPDLLRALWQQLAAIGRELGVDGAASRTDGDYDPEVYAQVYLHLLRHRRAQVLSMDEILPTTGFSPYAFTVPYDDLRPRDDEIRRHIETVEAAYPDPVVLEREINRWYESP